ncbi:MAG: sigma-70 family RNA polymerase sigma factor [Verrucomicrobiales bacterium]|nr:sigma-70 family RNA polymerase sigma factor [Verrucomicrobiales bacterium]
MPDPNDPEAEFVALLTSHQSAVRFYIASLLPGEARAADVAQQANITIWNKRDDFELGTNFKAWAFSIARYEVLNFRKREARDARLQFSDELEEIIADEIVSHTGDLDARQAALRHCLSKLKASDRALIQHRYFEDTSLKDYAANVGRSVGGLKVTLHRLRSGLAQCVRGQIAMERKTS